MFSRQSGKTSRPELWVDDIVEPTSSNEQSVTSEPSGQRSRIVAQLRDHDWAISSLVIYSAAAYDVTMKPSRGVLLISFVMFLPISLVYRRFFRRGIAASAAQRAFLVIGSGELARRFYEAYRQSPNQQRLEFVDNDDTRVGSTIAGEGSPIIQGDIAAKLAQLDRTYSGVIF